MHDGTRWRAVVVSLICNCRVDGHPLATRHQAAKSWSLSALGVMRSIDQWAIILTLSGIARRALQLIFKSGVKSLLVQASGSLEVCPCQCLWSISVQQIIFISSSPTLETKRTLGRSNRHTQWLRAFFRCSAAD